MNKAITPWRTEPEMMGCSKHPTSIYSGIALVACDVEKEDAEFIVSTVNLHAELLAALKELEDAAYFHDPYDSRWRTVKGAKEIIRKAEGRS